MSARGTIVAVGSACAATLALHAQAPQQPPPTFTSGTQVVQVDVRVFDKSGHFVTDLKPEDFTIKEDGVAQRIVSLALVDAAPLSLPAPAPLAPLAPLAPSAPPAPPAQPSVWLFLFDTPHLSAGGLHRTRGAVLDFINQRMHQGDLGGVVADSKMLNNRLTTDREELARAVDSIKLPGDTERLLRQMKFEVPRFADEYEVYRIAELADDEALAAAVQRGCQDDSTLCPVMPQLVRGKARDIDSRLHQESVGTVSTVRALGHGLARVPGPKTVVYISEGFMLWNVQSELKDAVGEANRAGAHVYAIDARGLNKGANADLLFATRVSDPMAGPRFDEKVDGPNSLAVDTGGMFIQNENNFDRVLDRIQQDAGTYYVVGYTPSNQAFDGKYRAISVSVGQPDVKVRARRGYLAIEPARMLVPVPIPATAAPAASSPARGSDAAATSANAPTEAPPPAAPAVTAEAVRTRIDKGGLVAELRGDEATPATDPASLGWAAYQRGDVETAARQLTMAAADPEAHPWVHYVLGLSQLALNQYPDAAASWERVRDAVPTFEPVYFNLADAYLLQSDLQGSLRVLDAAAKRWPADAEVFNAEGVLYLHQKVYDMAISAFQRATKIAPKDPLGFFNLASAHHANYLRLRRPTPTARQFMVSSRERDLSIDGYRKVIDLKGDYVEQAKKGLAALGAKPQ
jgi:VWFA-related protein